MTGHQPHVLMVSSNGSGMGHITRLLAMARRSSPETLISFASMSQAVPMVERTFPGMPGYIWEYIPSPGDLQVSSQRWAGISRRRFEELLDRRQPDILVFDGVYPYVGLLEAAQQFPQMRKIWSRRGMWQPGKGIAQLQLSDQFDAVIEPSDLAQSADQGATAHRTDAHRVPPVTLIDGSEQLSRAEAAAVLGVDPNRPTALITLSASSAYRATSKLYQLIHAAAEDPSMQIVCTFSVIAGAHADWEDGLPADIRQRLFSVSVYPIARCLSAVDYVVSAVGYNSFHECMAGAVPMILLPSQTGLDDQFARADWAQQQGAALVVRSQSDDIAAAVRRINEPGVRESMRQRALELAQPNGAPVAMSFIEGFLPDSGVR